MDPIGEARLVVASRLRSRKWGRVVVVSPWVKGCGGIGKAFSSREAATLRGAAVRAPSSVVVTPWFPVASPPFPFVVGRGLSGGSLSKATLVVAVPWEGRVRCRPQTGQGRGPGTSAKGRLSLRWRIMIHCQPPKRGRGPFPLVSPEPSPGWVGRNLWSFLRKPPSASPWGCISWSACIAAHS
jgi:hypothetical protein